VKVPMKMTRREFAVGSSALATLLMTRRSAFANPLGLPLGIQLYSVRQQMAQDLDGTFAAVAETGYTEVEAASLPSKSAKEIRAALDKAGLRCVSAHHGFADIHSRFEELVAYDKELGVQFVICASSGSRPASPGSASRTGMTLDDWHYSAEQFNAMGEAAGRMGVRFGYHNHSGEFTITEGKVPLMELLRLTNPEKVTFEMDCGWVIVGGAEPVEILRDHPHRFSMLHVKDFNFQKTATNEHDAKVTELGMGTIDYVPIFAQAAKSQHIQHAFVEQEGFDMPWKDSLKVDAAYMRKLT
jgi:sugar phosphate isomerase/epimerase